MKFTFKNTLLASAFTLLSLTACSSNNSTNQAQIETAKITVPAIPTNKTTGHKEEIIKSLKASLKLNSGIVNLDNLKNAKITFDENNYNANTDSLDISHVKIKFYYRTITIDRLVKDGKKSLQILNAHFGGGDSCAARKITIIGDLSQTKNIDVMTSINDVTCNDVYTLLGRGLSISSINGVSKVTNQGIEKFNFNVQGLDFVGISRQLEVIKKLKANFSFHKSNGGALDNNYDFDLDLNAGYGPTDPAHTATAHNNLHMQLDTKALKDLLIAFNTPDNREGQRDAVRHFQSSLDISSKFVSDLLTFKNNGLTATVGHHFGSRQFEKAKQDPIRTKTEFKNEARQEFQDVTITNAELDEFVKVMYNVVFNNKNLTLSTKAITPTPFKNIFIQMRHNKKVLNFKANN